MDMKVVEDHSRFAIPSLYFAEEGIASSIDRLLKRKTKIAYPGVNLDLEIENLHVQSADPLWGLLNRSDKSSFAFTVLHPDRWTRYW